MEELSRRGVTDLLGVIVSFLRASLLRFSFAVLGNEGGIDLPGRVLL